MGNKKMNKKLFVLLFIGLAFVAASEGEGEGEGESESSEVDETLYADCKCTSLGAGATKADTDFCVYRNKATYTCNKAAATCAAPNCQCTKAKTIAGCEGEQASANVLKFVTFLVAALLGLAAM